MSELLTAPNYLVLQVALIGRPNEVLVNQLVEQIAKLRFILGIFLIAEGPSTPFMGRKRESSDRVRTDGRRE
ncbi:hypothetical protein [Yersinia frederiksenii]|uniref:hypothetical protein n=1 Tax=Yersinia frederiksenii TaxID=29484 RepID=UPI0005E9A473|nr:hypothetical protein [Yersinia frederiksenii]CFR10432.1 Uncharacterised protein [Yersinia frederiksenii]